MKALATIVSGILYMFKDIEVPFCSSTEKARIEIPFLLSLKPGFVAIEDLIEVNIGTSTLMCRLNPCIVFAWLFGCKRMNRSVSGSMDVAGWIPSGLCNMRN